MLQYLFLICPQKNLESWKLQILRPVFSLKCQNEPKNFLKSPCLFWHGYWGVYQFWFFERIARNLWKIISPNCDRLALWNGRPVLLINPMWSCKSMHTTSVLMQLWNTTINASWVTLGFLKYHPDWKCFICFTWQKNMHELW